MHKVILLGAGEHAKVLLDCLMAQGMVVECVVDPKVVGDWHGIASQKEYAGERWPDCHALVPIGDNRARKTIAERCVHHFSRSADPSAVISPKAKLGAGSMVMQGAIVQTFANIGRHVIVNTGASVDHDCKIEDFVHLAPRSILCGRVQIGEGALIGAGAMVLPGVTIGKWSVVGAGSVVTRDVPDESTVVGNPARIIWKKRS